MCLRPAVPACGEADAAAIRPAQGLACLIQSYMVLDKPTELFSERVRAARWFEANAPQISI